ncbi:MAG: CDP-glucose 4,6-dehydratase [Elusimicrobiota bacterium]|jgi:CDP-glucose 4,6-dehydratase|nr:CDP-glucose 4,6-dehydratase [Elusimicrobiota bacterium]
MEGLMANFYKGKNVLVTGHSGFKGTWLCRVLTLMGAKVSGYSLAPLSSPNLFELINISNDMNSVFADIRDLENLKQTFAALKPEIVFHLAAQPLVRRSYQEPVETYQTNVLGTVNVLEAIRFCPSVKSFLNVTTDKVYKNIENQNKGYKETDELDGYDPYSNSKSCSELVTSSYKKSFFNEADVRISTARSGNVLGGGDFAPDRIIADAVRAIKDSKTLILRNPNSVRPYQHVAEAIFMYLLIAQKQFENSKYADCYNIGPDISDCLKTQQLIERFYNYFKDAKWEIQIDKNAPHEANFLMLDNTKIKKVFKWLPTIKIDQAIEYSAQWTKEFLQGGNFAKTMDDQIFKTYKKYQDIEEKLL